MAKPYRRRNYFINKSFQSGFILRFLAASMLANILTVATFIILARRKIGSMLFSMRLPQSTAGAILSPEAFTASIAAFVLAGLLVLWAAKRMYHKISGPLHRIRADLHKITHGNLGIRVTLRNEDDFKEFAEEINTMVQGINSRFTSLREQADQLAHAAKALENSSTTSESWLISQGIRQSVSSLEEQIRAFRI